MKRHFILVVLCMIISFVLIGCGQQNAPASAPTEPIGQAEENADVPQAEDVQSDESIPVETKFGTLYYNAQWADFMKISVDEQDKSVRVTFLATVKDTDFRLFDVVIGEWEGVPAGQITGQDAVSRNVYVVLDDVEPDASLSAEESNRLYAMQEDINFVLDHLK